MKVHRLAWPAFAGLASVAASWSAGCTTTSPDDFKAPDGGGPSLVGELDIACTDTTDDIYKDPGTLPADGEKGAILRCAPHKAISKEELESTIRDRKSDNNPPAYTGRAFTSGAKVYRILYRTERGTVPPTPGYSAAFLYLPDKPVAAKTPLVIAAHGSRGQGPNCAPSKLAPEGAYVHPDFEALVFPFVGLGYAVIAPDLAGYSNYGAAGNPPSAYSNAQDIGKGVLDSGRAMRKAAGSKLTDQVVIAGLSQGGHSALAALALSSTYGTAGNVAAIAVASPLWFSQRSWGAIFNLEGDYKVNESAAVPVSIWYHYTTGELLDGPGKGVLPFKEEHRAAIKKFVDTACWSGQYPDLKAIGTVASDFYDQTFINAVKGPTGFGSACATSGPEKEICERWMPRYLADRPVATGAAGKVPIFVGVGARDTTIPRDRLKCAVDALQKSTNPLSYCFDPGADHAGILRAQGDAMVDWVGNKALGLPITKKCPSETISFTDDAGAPVECATIPPNE